MKAIGEKVLNSSKICTEVKVEVGEQKDSSEVHIQHFST